MTGKAYQGLLLASWCHRQKGEKTLVQSDAPCAPDHGSYYSSYYSCPIAGFHYCHHASAMPVVKMVHPGVVAVARVHHPWPGLERKKDVRGYDSEADADVVVGRDGCDAIINIDLLVVTARPWPRRN